MLFRVEFYNQEEMSEQIALCEDDACSWKEKDKTYIFEKVEKINTNVNRKRMSKLAKTPIKRPITKSLCCETP